MGRIKDGVRAIVLATHHNRGTFILKTVLCLLVLSCAVVAVVFGNYETFFLCVLTLVLFMVPPFIEAHFSITIPETLEVVIVLFIFAAEILGEVFHFYTIVPFWDTILHTFNGFLAAAIGLALVSILNRSDRVAFALSPFFCVVVAFCFSMTIGVLWEFFEFGMDAFFGLDMQKDTVLSSISSVMLDPEGLQRPFSLKSIESVAVNGQELGLGGYLDIGLIDTMEDLLVNFAGALAFSILGYIYLKGKGRGTFVRRFVPVLARGDEGVLGGPGNSSARSAELSSLYSNSKAHSKVSSSTSVDSPASASTSVPVGSPVSVSSSVSTSTPVDSPVDSPSSVSTGSPSSTPGQLL